jgi:hypothetical protein
METFSLQFKSLEIFIYYLPMNGNSSDSIKWRLASVGIEPGTSKVNKSFMIRDWNEYNYVKCVEDLDFQGTTSRYVPEDRTFVKIMF